MVFKSAASNESTLSGALSYVSSGSVLECPIHGVVYRSHRNGFVANVSPSQSPDVHVEVEHLWPGQRTLQGTRNAGQHVMNGFTSLSTAVAAYTAEPLGGIASAFKSKLQPTSWVRDESVATCRDCHTVFEALITADVAASNAGHKEMITSGRKRHHCRSCGEIFCSDCSRFTRPVRGYGKAQRACKACYETFQSTRDDRGAVDTELSEVQTREYSETVAYALATVLEGAKSIVKDSTRPDYWEPDDNADVCVLCRQIFGRELGKHHCRACGKVVCDPCSR